MFRIILGCLTFEARTVAPYEILEDDTDRVACLADPNGLQHTSTSQLLQNIGAVEVSWCKLIVGLDATDVARGRFAKGDN